MCRSQLCVVVPKLKRWLTSSSRVGNQYETTWWDLVYHIAKADNGNGNQQRS